MIHGIHGDVSKQEVMAWLIKLWREQRTEATRSRGNVNAGPERIKASMMGSVVAKFAEDFCLPKPADTES